MVHRLGVGLATIFLFMSLLFPCACRAQPVSSTELINNAAQHDGQSVVYEGEVIGDIMVRQGYAWINVNDGKNAIGVWAPKDLIKDLRYTGSYKSKGDWIEVQGVFARACPQHGGDIDIHAQRIRTISAGREIIEKTSERKRRIAIALLGVLGLVWILTRLKLR